MQKVSFGRNGINRKSFLYPTERFIMINNEKKGIGRRLGCRWTQLVWPRHVNALAELSTALFCTSKIDVPEMV